MPVFGPYGLYGRIKGDKIIIHKCDLDLAVKWINDVNKSSWNDPDYQYYERMGAKYLIQDMADMIKKGKKKILEKYGKD